MREREDDSDQSKTIQQDIRRCRNLLRLEPLTWKKVSCIYRHSETDEPCGREYEAQYKGAKRTQFYCSTCLWRMDNQDSGIR